MTAESFCEIFCNLFSDSLLNEQKIIQSMLIIQFPINVFIFFSIRSYQLAEIIVR